MDKRVGFFVLLLLVFSITLSVRAQSSVSRIVITDVETTSELFPEILITATLLSTDGTSALNVPKELLSVSENGVLVDYEVSEVPMGTRTILVLDMGKWMQNQALQSRQSIKERMRGFALQYIDAMTTDDFLQIIAVYSKNSLVAQSFTNDKGRLRDVVLNLNWNNQDVSRGLEGIVHATAEMGNPPNDFLNRIIFISPGIMSRDIFGKNNDVISRDLNAKEIPLYSLYIPWASDRDDLSTFRNISNDTNGMYVMYLTDDNLVNFTSSISARGSVYKFRFRTNNGSDLKRTVKISYLADDMIFVSKEYSIDSSLIASSGVEILVNNGEPILLLPENEISIIPIHAVVSNLGNRIVENVFIQANGRQIGRLEQTGPDTFSGTWSFETNSFPVGHTELFFEVIVEDELGVMHKGSAAIAVNLNAPIDLLCRWVTNLPGIGNGLGSACSRSGFSLSILLNIILFVALLVIGAVVWIKRDQVMAAGKEVGVRITNTINTITNRFKKLEAKARLVALQGIPEGERREFDLFGETPIGRSRDAAALIFENDNVSRLHCIIHEGQVGNWTIDDQESANGTFVNGQKLVPFEEKEVETGSVIELGPVEYGGIKFRFEVVDMFSGVDDEYKVIYDAADDSTQPVSTRITKSVTNGAKDIDPSDPANQKW